MVIKQNNFNSGGEGVTITTGNSAAAGGDAFNSVLVAGTGTGVYSAAGGARGSMGVTISGVAATSDTFTLVYSQTGNNLASARTFFRFDAWPSAVFNFMRLRSASATSAQFIMQTSGILALQNSAGATLKNFNSNTALQLGTWYRLNIQAEVAATAPSTTNGTIQGQLYSNAGSLIDSYAATNVNAGTAVQTQGQFGKVTAGSEGTVLMDEVGFDVGTIAELPDVPPTDTTIWTYGREVRIGE